MYKYSKKSIFGLAFVLFLVLSSVSLVQAQEVKDPNPPPDTGPSVSINAVGGPDTFGYTFIDSNEILGPFFFFVDISGTGTDASLSCDDCTSGPVNIGFPFNYYGTIYNQVEMAANGFLAFGATIPPGLDISNDCPLPTSPSTGNGARLAVLHDDLDLRSGAGTGYYQNFPVCPTSAGGEGACTVFQWQDADHWFADGEDLFNFQAILYENGNILTQYAAGNPETGSGSTTGLQNLDATDGLTYACDTGGSIPDSLSVLFEIPKPFGVDINQGSCAFTKNTLNGVRVEGVTPNKNVALVLAKELGPLTIGGNVCNGLQLDIRKGPRVLAIMKADSNGVVEALVPVEHIEGIVDGYVQFVDVATCTKSDPIITTIFVSDIENDDLDQDGVLNCFDKCPEEGLPDPLSRSQYLGKDGCIKDCIIIDSADENQANTCPF